jgi:hypothetical protein
MSRTYSNHHPAGRAERRNVAAERKLIASFRVVCPHPKLERPPNHGGERRNTRAMLVAYRYARPERYPRQG